MDSGKSNLIDCWVIDTKIHQNANYSIYKVHHESKRNERYLLALSNSQNFLLEDLEDDNFPFLINCKPKYSYYDKHCFPIIPPSYSSGSFRGRDYFVFEKMNRSLSSVLSDPTVQLSSSDIAVITCQLLEIVGFCFSNNHIFKNISVNDFFLRKTTRGYRVVIINQNFYSNTPYFIEDPLFTSHSVMNGNEPTVLDNIISIAYILYYLQSGSLPWCGLDDNEMKAEKAQCSLRFAYPIQFFNNLFTDPELDIHHFIAQTITSLRKGFPKAQLTLGKDPQANLKKRRIQEQETPSQPTEEIPPTPSSRKVTISGQQHEMKDDEGRQVIQKVQQIASTRPIKRPSETNSEKPVLNAQDGIKTISESKSNKRHYPFEKAGENNRKRQKIIIQHKSFGLNLQRLLSSATTANLLMFAVASFT